MRRPIQSLLRLGAAALCGAAAAAGPAPLTTPEGYAVPQPGHRFEFPRDYGAHPDFRIEWWYLTGHLFAADGRRFGFEATFFRIAGPPGLRDDNPNFSRQQIYLAHMAVTDVRTGRFWHDERVNRAGWDARAAVGTLDLANGEWSLRLVAAAPPRLELRGGVRAEASFRPHPRRGQAARGLRGKRGLAQGRRSDRRQLLSDVFPAADGGGADDRWDEAGGAGGGLDGPRD